MAAGSYHSMRDHRGRLDLSCDVVVVGSGAGGAVVARELSASGQSVVVLEEGPRVTAAEYGAWRPSESLRHIWRDGAMTVAVGLGGTPAVQVAIGRCVGGSSVLTGGVCFRIPDAILDEWNDVLGLPDYDAKSMEPYFDRVEETIHVETVPESMQSRGTALFGIGAKKKGLDVQPMRRNTKGCQGCGRCNFGCPHAAKMSVDLSYLPKAVASGAEVHSHCRVDRVITREGRAVGVRGRLLNGAGGSPGDRLEVHAKKVVVACGAWHTPTLLLRSGIGRGHVGRHMTLHPGFRMFARFEEKIRGWRGALQSTYSSSLEDQGITMTSLFIPPGVLAATMPGVGVEHTDNASRVDHLAVYGGIIHDHGGGRIHPGFGREPFATFRMTKQELAKIPILLNTMAESFFEAGAREVYLPILGLRGQSPDAFRKLDLGKIPGRRIECGSQHPLGTAQMGATKERGATDHNGKVWDVDGLYVADGSILPTSLGVNPQVAIMAVATRVAARME
jgi:choline dehydrogenase-like flavoprotein